MDISSMIPQLDVIRYMDSTIDNKLKNDLMLDLFTKSCLILRNKLYIKYLLANSSHVLNPSDFFISISFDSKIRRYIDKSLSKIPAEVQKVIQNILVAIDNLDSSDSESIVTEAINTVELLLSNISDDNLKETLQGFITPLLYFFNRNSYEYNGPIILPKLSYADYTCYVEFVRLRSYKFSLQRDMYKTSFNEYFLSFQPSIIPATSEDLQLLSYETLNFLKSFEIPVFNYMQQPIFNILDIKDPDYFDTVLSHIGINEASRILVILFYNNSLANLFNQIAMDEKIKENAELNNLIQLIKIIGSGNIDLYRNRIHDSLHTVSTNMEAMEGYLDVWNEIPIELCNISLEATGTDEDDITTPDDEDNPSDSEEDEPSEEDSSSGDEEDSSQNNQLSKFGIELESDNPSLFDILRKFTYFRQLKGLLEQPGIPSLTKMFIRHWLRYWIFITTVKSTEAFLRKIKKIKS